MKRLIGIILSLIVVISCSSPISVEAKVIEPEIVKTESWTTSYYIDDDMDTLYPYIQCEADIYNDGTIKLYMWNTHEWDGFATVCHRITLTCPTRIVKNNSLIYSEKYGNIDLVDINGKFEDANNIKPRYYSFSGVVVNTDKSLDRSVLDKYDISYIPSIYTLDGSVDSIFPSYRTSHNISGLRLKTGINGYYSDITMSTYTMPLPVMDYSHSKPKYATFIARPTVDPTGTYNFRLFGHDITITPELLSGNIIAEPEITEQEKYIKQLEEENAKLKASITNTNLFGDINGDSLVDVADAQMILNYYVYTLVNSNAEPLEEWISKQ